MDHAQVVGRTMVLLMKRNMHALPKGRAPLPRAYKVYIYDLLCVAQQLILHGRVPRRPSYSKKMTWSSK